MRNVEARGMRNSGNPMFSFLITRTVVKREDVTDHAGSDMLFGWYDREFRVERCDHHLTITIDTITIK